jgi:hypothetical protein
VEFPLLQAMSYFPYRDNTLLEKGVLTGSVDLHYSNVYTFNFHRTVLNDFEFFSTVAGFRYGLGNGGTLELYLRHSALFGGTLDKFIEDFHRTFNLPDADRGAFPRNSVHYRYGDHFSYTENQNGFSPVILGYLKELYRSHHVSLKGRLALGIPLSNKPGLSSGKPFLTAGLIVSFKKKKLALEFSNYISFFKHPSWLEGEDLRSNMVFSRLEINFFRMVAGFVIRTSTFKMDDPSHTAYQIYFGYRITRRLEILIQEDFAPFDTTPDIGINLRFRFL